jgi:hypothetical protein
MARSDKSERMIPPERSVTESEIGTLSDLERVA